MKINYYIRAIFILSLAIFIGCGNSEGQVKDPTSASNIQKVIEAETSLKKHNLHHQTSVQEFYQNRQFEPVWNKKNLRKEFVSALQNASKEGLNYTDYHGDQIDDWVEQSSLNDENRAILDIILTDAYFEYSNHLLNGKIDPRELYSLWGIEKEDFDTKSALNNAVKRGSISGVIDSLRPPHSIYKGLMNSLETYRNSDNRITKVSSGEPINPGEKDQRIPEIAQRLKELNLISENYQTEENTYDETLQSAIKKLQEEHGFMVDGAIGANTIEVLNIDNEERRKQILVNLERWRWYPRNLGQHYVLVNIPQYRIFVVKDGDTISSRRAIVGKEERETPIFTDTIDRVVINPTWTVPPTILKRDVVPSAKEDPSYFSKNNMIVLDSDGNEVNPRDIDWEQADEYTYTQKAGPNNPLGRVKIDYPNQYLIYIHDTPGKYRFNENTRAISSGCVRVEDAIGLAEYVLQDQTEWNRDEIDETIDSGKTTHVDVEQEIVVHHLYYTAWINNGKTKFTNDIYDLDEAVYRKLQE